MTDTPILLRRKIAGADDLKSVVRTMKALAASSIVQYEEAVRALVDYAGTVDSALSVCFRRRTAVVGEVIGGSKTERRIGIIVFGSDQGLVGQFNEVVAEYALTKMQELPAPRIVWSVGGRVDAQLGEAGVGVTGSFDTPNSVAAITPLIGRLLLETETQQLSHDSSLYLFHNRPQSGADAVYQPVCLRVLPLDAAWRNHFAETPWPTDNLPEIVGDFRDTLKALIREYLFVTLFRACAESLAAENAARLAAMQRAEKNIERLLDDLNRAFHQIRQSSIDAELFDVIGGYESMTKKR
ncbi:MAG: F0F1 ATP synthase subunit gamma [Gammaproteobacteria bacterium]